MPHLEERATIQKWITRASSLSTLKKQLLASMTEIIMVHYFSYNTEAW